MWPWALSSSFTVLKGLFIGYWLILGRSFEVSFWNLIEEILWVLPISVGDFAHKKSGYWFNGDKMISVSEKKVSLARKLAWGICKDIEEAQPA